MKYIGMILILLLSRGTQAQTDRYKVVVEGMGCAFCANGVENKLQTWKSVKDLKIELETGLVSFSMPSAQARKAEELAALIGKAGYTAKSVEIRRADGSIEQFAPQVSAGGKGLVASFAVAGACGMCKERVEAAAHKIKGVHSAVWDVDKEQMRVEFDPARTSEADIQGAIARSGHDTPMFKAPDSSYKKLPACCQYRD